MLTSSNDCPAEQSLSFAAGGGTTTCFDGDVVGFIVTGDIVGLAVGLAVVGSNVTLSGAYKSKSKAVAS